MNKGMQPRLLFLGGGAVVTEFYLPALARLGWRQGHLVCDKSARNLDLVRRAHPGMQTFQGGYEELLGKKDLVCERNAAVVALPNWLHVAAVEASLQAGLAVLCEKPLALTAQECLRLGEVAKLAGRPLAVGMVRRHIPALQAAKELVKSGKLGELRRVMVEHGGPYVWTSDSGEFFRKENGGILADLGVHYLDWLGDVLGPLEPEMYEDDACGGVEASCNYGLRTAHGVPVRLRLTHLRPRADTVVLEGEKGTVTIHRNQFDQCTLKGLGQGLATEVTPERPFADAGWPRDFISCFAQQLTEFGTTLRSGEPRISAGEAAKTIALIEHAYRNRVEQKGIQVLDDPGPKLFPGKTVVTGGTGFIGGALVERLHQLGFPPVTVPVRSYRTCANVARFPVELPRIDLTQREQVRRTVQGARWVFHLAYGQTDAEARRITVQGTKILVEEAARAGVEALVVLSSMAVFGKPETPEPVDESWPQRPAYGTYGRTKAEMERWCLQRQKKGGGMRLAVLNPTCVFGPGGKTYTQMPQLMAREGRFAWIEEGRGTANLVYIDNLVDAMLLAAGSVQADGQRFLVNDESVTWREFFLGLFGEETNSWPDLSGKPNRAAPASRLREIVRHLLNDYALLDLINRHPVLSHCKRAVMRFRRAALEQAREGAAPAGSATPARPEPPAWLVELFGPETTRFSSQKLRALGWKPKVGFAEALRRTRSWLQDPSPEKPI